MSIFKSVNIKSLIFSLFLVIFTIISLDISLSNESINKYNPIGLDTAIYPNEATAQNVCTFNCRRGLDDCGGAPDCTQRYICDSGCGACTIKWIKYTSGSTSGKCNNSGVVVD